MEDFRRILSSEETQALFMQTFLRGLSGEADTEESSRDASLEYCRVEDIEKAKSVLASELRIKLIDRVVNETSKRNRLTPEDVHKLRGLLLDALGRLNEY